MPPRAIWKGHLKLSLVSFGVRLYNATSSASRVQLNQLNRKTMHRLKQRMVDGVTGEEVPREDIAKGFEYEKDRYVIVEPEDLESIRVESTKTIELTQFVDQDELEPIYFNAPYYLAPDGPVAEEAFAVVKAAMERAGRIGIGRLVLSAREHVVAVEPHGKGMQLTTLRASSEVRDAAPYFEDVAEPSGPADQVTLAEQLVESFTRPLDPAIFNDRYNEALLGVIRAKIEGGAPAVAAEVEAERTLNFMEALRASLDGDESTGDAPAARAPRRAAGTGSTKTSARKPAAKSSTKKPPARSVGGSKKRSRKQA